MLRRLMMAVDAGVDPSWNSVSSLLHFDDSFVDQKSKIWTPNGGVSIDPNSKFGAGAALFDGSGYLTTPSHVDFALEMVDFTIECWVRRSVANALHYIFSHRPNSSAQQGYEFRINADNRFQIFYTGGTSVVSTLTVSAGVWHHIAACRSAGKFYLWLNGGAAGEGSASNGTPFAGTSFLGRASDNSGGFNGSIDDFRVTKGVARYTSPFIPPTAAFPDG